MKNLIVCCLCLAAGSVMAQVNSETLTLKAVKKGEEPEQVMKAIQEHFPKAVVSDLSFLPAKLYGEQWSVNLEDDSNGTPADLYQVSGKEGNERFKAVFDASGKEISSMRIINQAQLPTEVASAIAERYPSWKVVDDQEKVTYQHGRLKEAYHVRIQENKTTRSLLIDNDGKIVKDKLTGRAK
jgi:hypothetical protein